MHRRTSCTVKKVHYDFLSVMQHCISLHRNHPLLNISAYKCDYCDGMHITTGRKPEEKTAKLILATNLRLMRNIGWWEQCPPDIQNQRIDLEITALITLHNLEVDK